MLSAMTQVARVVVGIAALLASACSSSGDDEGSGQNASSRPSAGCGASSVSPDPTNPVFHITHDGVEREYKLHVPPSYDGTKPMRLVVNFHGLTSNMDQQIVFSGMDATADAQGFIVAYPNGLPNPGGTTQSWNAGACCAFGDTTRDDVGFTRAVVADIESRACIDERRVFATGMSNGGFMSHMLGCEAADLFTAVAPVAGGLGIPTCNPSRPIPIIAFHGTADTLVAYDGGGIAGASIPDTLQGWATRNGCSSGPTETFRNGTAHCDTWTGCSGGVMVRLCTLDGEGHCWPGTGFCPFGAFTTDISANDAMLAFFEPYALP